MTQEKALNILKSGKNVFLTGQAGAGKTYVLHQYIQYLREKGIPYAVTASTGIAASHLNGSTIHSWCGMGIKDAVNSRDLQAIALKKHIKKRVEDTAVLIIDEISMLHKRQLDTIDHILQHLREGTRAFGGLQLVLCGDFFQLPPIGTPNESARERMAFMSEAWIRAELQVCYLSSQHRQNNDELSHILNAIRDQSVSQVHLNWLDDCIHHQVKNATFLYTHNTDVERLNTQYLSEINSKSEFFNASGKGNKKILQGLYQSALCPKRLELKKGAKVMFVKNNFDKNVVNGTLGVVDSFTDDGWPLVLCNNGSFVEAEPETWRVDDENGKPIAQFDQVPLRLAYAITVHKSQGMTLDAASIDLSKTFERGQGYVALSRLRSLKTLKLVAYNGRVLEVDALVAKADKRFKQLALLAEKLDDQFLSEKSMSFVKKHGKEISPSKQHDKKTVQSTYDITAELIKNKKSVSEIANERDLKESTILSHLLKMRELYPDLDIAYLSPPDTHLLLINEAKEILKREKKNETSVRNIYDVLNKSLSYDAIKLALAFSE